MTTAVTLDVYSGRTNPTWQLTPKQEKELNDRMSSLKLQTHQRPSGAVGGLGYRGFKLTSHDSTFAATGLLRVHEGIVDRGVSQANLVDNTEMEKFILGTFTGKFSDEVTSHVQARLVAASNFGLDTSVAGCPACAAADAPAYNPGAWNNPAVQPHNNCYNYANDNPTNTFAQPGRAHGVSIATMDCAHVQPGAIADGLVRSPNFSAPLKKGAGWYVALVIWPGADYHWYRQDDVGCWSHKPGQTAVRNVDNSGKTISDPKSCDRGPYTIFCDYMISRRGLTIS